MLSVLRIKRLSAVAVLGIVAVFGSSSARAADTLTDAISLHNTGVSDDVMTAWAGQQPPVAKTTDNLIKLKDAKLSGPVVDALLVGNTRPKVAVAPKPAARGPQNDESDIRLAGNAAVVTDPPSPIICGIVPTVVIDGNNVYNYDPFHTVVYGWPNVYAIYPWYAENSNYRFAGDWRRDDWNWNREHDSFRWQNQISNPATPVNGTAVSNYPPHWPHKPELNSGAQFGPHVRPHDFEQQQQPTLSRTAPAHVDTHVTNSGVKYVTQAPQSQASSPVQPAQTATPHYYVPPANNAAQPQSSTTPAWMNGPTGTGGFRR
jgi:hypothetical protein